MIFNMTDFYNFYYDKVIYLERYSVFNRFLNSNERHGYHVYIAIYRINKIVNYLFIEHINLSFVLVIICSLISHRHYNRKFTTPR